MNENVQSMKNSFFEGIKENAGAALGMGLVMLALGALALAAPGNASWRSRSMLLAAVCISLSWGS